MTSTPSCALSAALRSLARASPSVDASAERLARAKPRRQKVRRDGRRRSCANLRATRGQRS
eukprot:6186597-Pleurochrysis_carterae.AAC.1